MKRTLKITFGLLLSVPFLMSLGCPGFQRMPCKYEDSPVKAYISHYEMEQDSIIEVWFNALDEQKSWVWNTDDENRSNVRVHAYDLEQFDLTIDPETINDTTILYLVEGSFIIQGTCSPETIHSVKKVN